MTRTFGSSFDYVRKNIETISYACVLTAVLLNVVSIGWTTIEHKGVGRAKGLFFLVLCVIALGLIARQYRWVPQMKRFLQWTVVLLLLFDVWVFYFVPTNAILRDVQHMTKMGASHKPFIQQIAFFFRHLTRSIVFDWQGMSLLFFALVVSIWGKMRSILFFPSRVLTWSLILFFSMEKEVAKRRAGTFLLIFSLAEIFVH